MRRQIISCREQDTRRGGVPDSVAAVGKCPPPTGAKTEQHSQDEGEGEELKSSRLYKCAYQRVKDEKTKVMCRMDWPCTDQG